MTIANINRSFVGFSSATFRRLSDNLIISFPPPSAINLDPVEQVREQLTRNNLGKQARAQTFSTGSLPTLTMSYGVLTPEIIGFRLGRQMANVTTTLATSWPYQLRVTAETYPAQSAGFLGNAVVADDEAYGSVIRNGVSTALTQQDFADHATWKSTADQFGLGGDGALAFSTNLVTNNDVVTLIIPETLPDDAGVTRISALPAGAYEMTARLVDTLGQISLLTVYNCEPNPANAAIDFSAESVDVTMNVNAAAGTCNFFQLLQTTLTVSCV